MATQNGTAELSTLEAATALDARQHDQSVKHSDFANGGTFLFTFPFGYGGYSNSLATLPEVVPPYEQFGFATRRDLTLLSTVKREAMWASTVGIAVTKAAAWGWEIESTIPLRRKRAHQVLMNSTAGSFAGWVHFLSAHLRSFLLTGLAVVEIERETHAYGSRIRALHHLNPLRCRITNDPVTPVQYMDRKGDIHDLKYWQVMMFGDNLDPTEGEAGLVESAAERAYDRIKLMSGITQYLYEKVTGKRILSIEFIPGVTSRQLENAFQTAETERQKKGNMLYMGALVVPLPADTPVQRVSIPLAELPEGFDPQNLRDDATVIYAGATGQDVNDIDPRLASRQTMGSGAQSIVLAEKAKGKGMAAWRQNWMHNMNTLVLDDTATTFAWAEQSLDDEERKANIEKIRTDTNKTRIEMQVVTTEQARNLLVDSGDLPAEFLDTDITAGGRVGDNDKSPSKEDVEDESTDAPGKTAVAQEDEDEDERKPLEESDAQKEARRKRPLDVARLLREQASAARELAEDMGVTAVTTKHLGGQHNQKRHAWRFVGNEQSTTNARRSMTATPNKGEREEYKKRARQRLGLPDKPVREPGKRDGATAAQPKRRGDVVRERVEAVGSKNEAAAAEKKAVYERELSKWKELSAESKKAEAEYKRVKRTGGDDLAAGKIMAQKIQAANDQVTVVNKAQKEYTSLKENVFEDYARALRVDDPTSLAANYVSIGKDRKKGFDGVVDMVGGMVSREVMPPGLTVNINGKSGQRANYVDGLSQVNIKVGGGRTMAHELGHHIEHKSPGLYAKAKAFLDKRTAGEREMSLRAATGVNYGRGEWTRKDKWVNAYMGKSYKGATELISMGIEYLLSEPMTLLRQDPEYFYFLIEVLQGG